MVFIADRLGFASDGDEIWGEDRAWVDLHISRRDLGIDDRIKRFDSICKLQKFECEEHFLRFNSLLLMPWF